MKIVLSTVLRRGHYKKDNRQKEMQNYTDELIKECKCDFAY